MLASEISGFSGVPGGSAGFSKNEMTKSILVPIRGDRVVEPTESFSVRLANAKGAQIARGEGFVTIVDNEAMGLDLGASSYLVKPVDRERLATLIEKHRAMRFSTVGKPGVPPANWPPKGQKSSRKLEPVGPRRD